MKEKGKAYGRARNSPHSTGHEHMRGEIYSGVLLATAIAREELNGEELKGIGMGNLFAQEGEEVLPATNFRTDKHQVREDMKMSGHEREWRIAEHKRALKEKEAKETEGKGTVATP